MVRAGSIGAACVRLSACLAWPRVPDDLAAHLRERRLLVLILSSPRSSWFLPRQPGPFRGGQRSRASRLWECIPEPSAGQASDSRPAESSHVSHPGADRSCPTVSVGWGALCWSVGRVSALDPPRMRRSTPGRRPGPAWHLRPLLEAHYLREGFHDAPAIRGPQRPRTTAEPTDHAPIPLTGTWLCAHSADMHLPRGTRDWSPWAGCATRACIHVLWAEQVQVSAADKDRARHRSQSEHPICAATIERCFGLSMVMCRGRHGGRGYVRKSRLPASSSHIHQPSSADANAE